MPMVKCRNSRARLLLLAGCLICGAAPILVHSQPYSKTPVEHVIAPGGKVVYYIMSLPGKDSMGNPNLALEAGMNGNSSFRIFGRTEMLNLSDRKVLKRWSIRKRITWACRALVIQTFVEK